MWPSAQTVEAKSVASMQKAVTRLGSSCSHEGHAVAEHTQRPVVTRLDSFLGHEAHAAVEHMQRAVVRLDSFLSHEAHAVVEHVQGAVTRLDSFLSHEAHAVVDFELDFEANLAPQAGLQGLLRSVLPFLILLCLPVTSALRGVAFKWAAMQMDGDFATIAPLMFGSIISASFFLFSLLVSGGAKEAGKLIDRKYLIPALPMLFSSVSFTYALKSGASPTIVTLMMKCAILPSIFGEMLITWRRPYATQVLTVAVILICSAMFVLQSGSNPVGSVAGMCWAAALPFAHSTATTMLEMAVRGCVAESENKRAAQIRVLFAGEFWSAVFQSVLVVVVEWDFVKRGLVKGWTLGFVLGAVLPPPLAIITFTTSVVMVGSLRANIIAVADIGVAYFLESIIFQSPIGFQPLLNIAAITILILVHTSFSIDLRKHAAARPLSKARAKSEGSCRQQQEEEEKRCEAPVDDNASVVIDIDASPEAPEANVAQAGAADETREAVEVMGSESEDCTDELFSL